MKSNRIRIIKWIILVILFMIALFYFAKIITYIMKPTSVDLNNIAGIYGEKKNSLDMVYIGGSACIEYWAPLLAFEREGIASYDYATHGIQAELYKTMIKEVEKTQNPKLIVIDARAFQYRGKEYNPTEVSYRNVLTGMPLSLNKIEFIKNNVPKYLNQNTFSYYFDIVKYHRNLGEDKIGEQIKMALGTYKNKYKGFDFIKKVKRNPQNTSYETTKKTAIEKESEAILIDLLEYIKTTNYNYLFVVSPYMEKEEHKENFNYIADIVGRYGYNFLDGNDYYDKMQINFNVDFYDHNHANLLGAEKYTNFLINYIKEHYDLPDRRGEYKDWEALLPNWKEDVIKTKEDISLLIELQDITEQINSIKEKFNKKAEELENELLIK